MAQRNSPKRRIRKPIAANPVRALSSGTHEPCEQCRLSGRRIRISVFLPEAQDIVDSLTKNGKHELAAFFQAHLTIASRPDSYDYD